ncbi:hypothetical protein GEMRC1_004339 [Eukaryota sp. GEM-RC1]
MKSDLNTQTCMYPDPDSYGYEPSAPPPPVFPISNPYQSQPDITEIHVPHNPGTAQHYEPPPIHHYEPPQLSLNQHPPQVSHNQHPQRFAAHMNSFRKAPTPATLPSVPAAQPSVCPAPRRNQFVTYNCIDLSKRNQSSGCVIAICITIFVVIGLSIVSAIDSFPTPPSSQPEQHPQWTCRLHGANIELAFDIANTRLYRRRDDLTIHQLFTDNTLHVIDKSDNCEELSSGPAFDLSTNVIFSRTVPSGVRYTGKDSAQSGSCDMWVQGNRQYCLSNGFLLKFCFYNSDSLFVCEHYTNGKQLTSSDYRFQPNFHCFGDSPAWTLSISSTSSTWHISLIESNIGLIDSVVPNSVENGTSTWMRLFGDWIQLKYADGFEQVEFNIGVDHFRTPHAVIYDNNGRHGSVSVDGQRGSVKGSGYNVELVLS